MRVIAGLSKGRRLKAPKGMKTRPTIDRVKEALFNILGENILNTVFLDLYAGTGSIGIEALSRGAEEAIFVERDAQAYKVLQDNIKVTGFSQSSEVYRQDVHRALSILRKRGTQFDIIFADPPYSKDLVCTLLEGINNNKLLKGEGLVIIESSIRDEIPEQVFDLKKYREEKYGDTKISFYKF